MDYLKEKTMAKVDVSSAVKFLTLAGAAIILPFYIHLQLLTGPIINAILILTLFLVGIRSALIVCLVPSLMALSGGLLPAVLAPAVPFIMMGNVILVLIIDWFYQNFKSGFYGYWLGVFVGAGIKFLFLFFSVRWISSLLIKQSLAANVAKMMSWPQFATAVSGGLIAWVILKWLKRI